MMIMAVGGSSSSAAADCPLWYYAHAQLGSETLQFDLGRVDANVWSKNTSVT